MKIEEFEEGKWYKNLGSDNNWIGKYYINKKDSGEKFQATEWITPEKIHQPNDFGFISHIEDAELYTLDEIYEFLPIGHPDKIKIKKTIDKSHNKILIKLLKNV